MGHVHAAPDGRQEDEGKRRVWPAPGADAEQDRVLSGKDQEKVQVNDWHQQSKEYEWIDQGGANHDFRPVVSSHVSADSHEAEQVKKPRGNIVGPFPENACSTPKIKSSCRNQTNDQT